MWTVNAYWCFGKSIGINDLEYLHFCIGFFMFFPIFFLFDFLWFFFVHFIHHQLSNWFLSTLGVQLKQRTSICTKLYLKWINFMHIHPTSPMHAESHRSTLSYIYPCTHVFYLILFVYICKCWCADGFFSLDSIKMMLTNFYLLFFIRVEKALELHTISYTYTFIRNKNALKSSNKRPLY